MIWKREFTIDDLAPFTENTMVGHLGIAYLEKGADYLTAAMPVDHRTHQPMGLLHGGASVALAETLGSSASYMTLDEGLYSVGLEINANHIKSVTSGRVIGKARPLHLGRTTQVWQTVVANEEGKKLAVVSQTQIVMPGNGSTQAKRQQAMRDGKTS